MFRFLFLILLIYLVYKVIRMLFAVKRVTRKFQEEEFDADKPQPKEKKLIGRDEGEYVDFEEMKP